MDVFHLVAGEGPLIAAAIHNGHAVRSDVGELLALDDATRLREEDPFTDQLAALVPTRIVGQRSRFEVDLNRPREQAVYFEPEDAWGLNVWREKLPEQMVTNSLANYDLFYATVRGLLQELVRRHGRVVVLDIHSYNHRRGGPEGPAARGEENPEINLGTATVDRRTWGALVERFVGDLRGYDYLGRQLDVRENVKFFGGHFPRWINGAFGGRACALAVEFKKTFMDEWTGEVDRRQFAALQAALSSTIDGLLDELRKLKREP